MAHARQLERQTKRNVTVRLSQRTLDRMQRCLIENLDERPSDFMRAAILRELTRRERNGKAA